MSRVAFLLHVVVSVGAAHTQATVSAFHDVAPELDHSERSDDEGHCLLQTMTTVHRHENSTASPLKGTTKHGKEAPSPAMEDLEPRFGLMRLMELSANSSRRVMSASHFQEGAIHGSNKNAEGVFASSPGMALCMLLAIPVIFAICLVMCLFGDFSGSDDGDTRPHHHAPKKVQEHAHTHAPLLAPDSNQSMQEHAYQAPVAYGAPPRSDSFSRSPPRTDSFSRGGMPPKTSSRPQSYGMPGTRESSMKDSRENTPVLTDILCPSLVVPAGGESVYLLPQFLKLRNPIEAFHVLRHDGAAVLGVVVKEGDQDPGILLHGPHTSTGPGKPLAFVGTGDMQNRPGHHQANLVIARPSSAHPRGETYGSLEPVNRIHGGGHKVVRNHKTMLQFQGSTDDLRIKILDEDGKTVGSMQPQDSGPVDDAGQQRLELRLMGGVDAGLAILSVLGIIRLNAWFKQI